MQLIRCTRKLMKEIGNPPTNEEPTPGNLGGWHANLLRFERRKCVLFTNDVTLFSIFAPGLKKPDFQALASVFGQKLFRNLRLEGFSQEQIESVLDEYRTIGFAKTNNRSVLGSMNDLAFQLEWIVHSGGGLFNAPHDEVNRKLNRIPMGALREHCYSIDALRIRLERNAC